MIHGGLYALLAASLALGSLANAEDAPPALRSCDDVAAGDDQQALLCQIAGSTQMLAHLGILVNDALERVLENNGLTAATESAESDLSKRKHEYLRFGKRKHEYLRFGKRKHEYLRFGRK